MGGDVLRVQAQDLRISIEGFLVAGDLFLGDGEVEVQRHAVGRLLKSEGAAGDTLVEASGVVVQLRQQVEHLRLLGRRQRAFEGLQDQPFGFLVGLDAVERGE